MAPAPFLSSNGGFLARKSHYIAGIPRYVGVRGFQPASLDPGYIASNIGFFCISTEKILFT